MGGRERDLVNFSFVRPYRGIAQVKVMFNQEAAKLERSWVSGLSWGFQLYAEWFEAKPGGILVISQTIEPIQTQGVGPNQVKNPHLDQKTTTVSPKPSSSRPEAQLNKTEEMGASGPPTPFPNSRTSDP